MTDEERMEFLRQSIESHDRQIGELVENTAKNEAQQAKTDAQLAKTDAQLARTDALLAALIESTQINFDRLTQAMLGLVEHATNHSRRLEKLENQS